ncbi:MAG: hypothetical protein HOK57_02375 [Planctomycetaceae bacterium]|nr:hypothetical protein [Planctomycetaceae bacterium]MBT6458649.1 hypothetical protein [Planctomycetaceae bacterium]MBT6642054.1 hypothetical protein [Planctomycetaceae bacterium]
MHTISLSRVWERYVLKDESFVWVRRFQKPSNIDSGELVYLVAEPLLLGRMWLNDNSLRDLMHEEHRVCISWSLCQRNSLAFCEPGLPDGNSMDWMAAVRSGLLPSERIDLPIKFGKVVLKID